MIKLNLNPKGLKTGDCVIRAIAYASQQNWNTVYEELCKIGLKMKRMPNEKQVYEKYLEQLGFIKFKQPRKADNTKYTIDEFIYSFINYEMVPDTAVISVANHLTAIVRDNFEYELVDTWNCGYKSVGNYWVKYKKSFN